MKTNLKYKTFVYLSTVLFLVGCSNTNEHLSNKKVESIPHSVGNQESLEMQKIRRDVEVKIVKMGYNKSNNEEEYIQFEVNNKRKTDLEIGTFYLCGDIVKRHNISEYEGIYIDLHPISESSHSHFENGIIMFTPKNISDFTCRIADRGIVGTELFFAGRRTLSGAGIENKYRQPNNGFIGER